MDKYQEYLRNAAVCVRLSQRSCNDEFKQSWLKLAQAWLDMAPGADRADQPFKVAA
jgi:hypothetical protein